MSLQEMVPDFNRNGHFDWGDVGLPVFVVSFLIVGFVTAALPIVADMKYKGRK